MESRSRYPVSDSVTARGCFSRIVTEATKLCVGGGNLRNRSVAAGHPVEKRRFIRGVTASFGVNFQCRGLATLMPTQLSRRGYGGNIVAELVLSPRVVLPWSV